MTKISAIVCTVHLRHKSKQKKHRATAVYYSCWFSLILVKTLVAVLTHCFSVTVWPPLPHPLDGMVVNPYT